MVQTVAGYVRRSHAGEAAISEKVQRETIARLAKERGLTVDRVYMDWGRTGRLPDDVDGDTLAEILAHRPRALEMMRDIEAGTIGAVLAYRQDRLARDSFTLHMMIRRARRYRVPLIIPRGDITAREQRLLTAVEGGMDEEEGTRAKERSDAAEKTMTERGDERGAAPYGWSRKVDKDGRVYKVKSHPEKPARVVELYRALGTYNATARRLNDDGVPPPAPKKRRQSEGRPPLWSAATVRDIIRREAPELAANAPAIPRRAIPRLLRGLLRCHCGAPMTASGNERGRWYYCNRGKRSREGHAAPQAAAKKGRKSAGYTVQESRLLPWIMKEADRLAVPYDVAESEGPEYDDSEDRRRLDAARDLIGEEAYRDALDRLRAAQDAHSERQAIRQAIPPRIEWEAWSTEAVNAALRALWEYVQLGDDLLPVRAEWRVPEWRTAD